MILAALVIHALVTEVVHTLVAVLFAGIHVPPPVPPKTLNFFVDVKVVAGTITAVVILTMQGLTFWKQLSTNKAVRGNAAAIASLNRSVDGDIRKQLESLKATSLAIKETVAHSELTIAHLEKLLERRSATTQPDQRFAGDRDRRLVVRREPPKTVAPIHDPKTGTGIWPIGGPGYLGDSP
jgi:hypothetical protein